MKKRSLLLRMNILKNIIAINNLALSLLLGELILVTFTEYKKVFKTSNNSKTTKINNTNID